jgi:hypothetical protein
MLDQSTLESGLHRDGERLGSDRIHEGRIGMAAAPLLDRIGRIESGSTRGAPEVVGDRERDPTYVEYPAVAPSRPIAEDVVVGHGRVLAEHDDAHAFVADDGIVMELEDAAADIDAATVPITRP